MWSPKCLFQEINYFEPFVQLILRKIIKIVATICQILRLKCTKIQFRLGCASDHDGGAFSAPQTPSWI